MRAETIKRLHALVRLCNEIIAEHDTAAKNAQIIKDVLLDLIAATPEAEEADVLKIGCQPAVYKNGDGRFSALAHGSRATYVMDIKRGRGRVVGRFLIDGREALHMEGDSFRRVIRCLASASNAYIALNQHAKERRRQRRAAKKEGR